jgi:hypothetical protein
MEESAPFETKEEYTSSFRVGAMDVRARTTLSTVAFTDQ